MLIRVSISLVLLFAPSGAAWAQGGAREIARLRPLADAGDPRARHQIGVIYANGNGVTRDDCEAAAWFDKAGRYAPAAFSLGEFYKYGRCVPQDFGMAQQLFAAAASLDPQNAQYEIARDEVARLLAAPTARSKWTALTPSALLPSHPEEKATDGSRQHETRTEGSETRVRLKRDGGTYKVPVQINGVITLSFTVDSGAADVTIPADVCLTLYRTGTIEDSDFVGEQKYRLADGSEVKSATFRIRSLKVGNQTLSNILGSVADIKGSLLLGQSFLSQFRSWSIDNATQELILVPR